MPDVSWFARRILEVLVNRQESYFSLLWPEGDIAGWLGRAPTDEEQAAAQVAFQRLVLQGYIFVSSFQPTGNHAYRTSETGKQALRKGKFDPEAGLPLSDFVSDDRVLDAAEQAFDGGRFGDAVFQAAKALEIAVRQKAELGSDDLGQNLMVDAFKAVGGRLKIPMCEVGAEQEGGKFLFMGMTLFFKNPGSHRLTEWIDRKTAIRALQFAELLFMLVDRAEFGEGDTSEG